MHQKKFNRYIKNDEDFVPLASIKKGKMSEINT